jgi:hypothetical protein
MLEVSRTQPCAYCVWRRDVDIKLLIFVVSMLLINSNLHSSPRCFLLPSNFSLLHCWALEQLLRLLNHSSSMAGLTAQVLVMALTTLVVPYLSMATPSRFLRTSKYNSLLLSHLSRTLLVQTVLLVTKSRAYISASGFHQSY